MPGVALTTNDFKLTSAVSLVQLLFISAKILPEILKSQSKASPVITQFFVFIKVLRAPLPKQYLRHGSEPLVIGQKQKWYLLKLVSNEQKVKLDLSESPEFDSWRWIDFHEPEERVIFFKRQVYIQALKELEPLLKTRRTPYGMKRKRGNHRP